MAEKSNEIPVKGVVLLAEMLGEDEEETRLLRVMASEAQEYIQSFSWCKSIRESYFGDGCGGIIAIFFFRIEPSSFDVGEWLWVVVGDLPPAYLVIDENKPPSQSLESYIDEMSKCVKLAKQVRSSKKVIPVNVPSTPENAILLGGRLEFLSETILPAFQSSEAVRS